MKCDKCEGELSKEAKFCPGCGVETKPKIDFKPTPWTKRFVNLLIDFLCMALISYPFWITFGAIFSFIGMDVVTNFIIDIDKVSEGRGSGVVLLFFYYLFFESLFQKSPSKFITRTKVVTFEGKKPNFSTIVTRTISRVIPLDALSFLDNYFPVGWHDKFSKTIVVPDSFSADDVKKINIDEFTKNLSSSFVGKVIKLLLLIALMGIISSIIIVSLNPASK
ncbi:MAG: RDD family protein [bacterium]